MPYAKYWWLRFVLALVMIVYAGCTIYRFATADHPMKGLFYAAEVVFWTLGPPLWFFLEYWWIDNKKITGLPQDVTTESVKAYADYASKIWAAVLAAVLFLYRPLG